MSSKESLDSIAEFIGGTRKNAFSLLFRDDIYASLDGISHEGIQILAEVDPEIQKFFKLLDEKFSDDVNRLSIEEKIKAYFILKDHQENIEYLESCSKRFFHKFSFKLASEMDKKDFSKFLYYKIFENSSVSDVSSFIEDVLNQELNLMVLL